VLESGGRIAVVDFIRGTNPFAAVFGVNMLANTVSGDTYTLGQYTEWLEAAGFGRVAVYGSLDGEPYTMDSEAAVFVAIR